jgi:Tfp pilus assembly protein PilZ
VLVLYTRFPDEARLLAAQEAASIRAIVLSPRTPAAAVRQADAEITARMEEGRPSLVVIGECDDGAQREALQELGVRWALRAPFEDGELRFVVNAAMAFPWELRRRETQRAPVNVIASLEATGVSSLGVMNSVSAGGAFIELSEPPPVGTDVHVAFTLDDFPIVAEARVVFVNTRASAWAPSFPRGMGVAFRAIDEQDREQIEAWVKSRLERYSPRSE